MGRHGGMGNCREDNPGMLTSNTQLLSINVLIVKFLVVYILYFMIILTL